MQRRRPDFIRRQVFRCSGRTDQGAFGSLMELSLGGKQPVELPNGEQRRFLEDGDELILSATAAREGYRSIGFGTCSGTVVPAG